MKIKVRNCRAVSLSTCQWGREAKKIDQFLLLLLIKGGANDLRSDANYTLFIPYLLTYSMVQSPS